MKQQRDLLNESNKDKQDWQRYQAENVAQYDFQSYDQISTLLRLLMHSVQQKSTPVGPPMRNNSAPNMGGHFGGSGHQQNPNYQGGNRNYQNNRQGGQNYRGNQNPQMNMRNDHQHQIRNQPPMPAAMPQPTAMPQPQQMPIPQAMPGPAGPGAMPTAPGVQSQVQLQFVPSNDPISAEFYSKTMPIYAAITEINPSYKQTVGSTIFEFVTKLVGPQFAPKITGMLIDLPIVEIQRYVTNFDLLAQRVNQAQGLLQQQAQTGTQQ